MSTAPTVRCARARRMGRRPRREGLRADRATTGPRVHDHPRARRTRRRLPEPFAFDLLDAEGASPWVGDAPPQELTDQIHASWVRFVTYDDPLRFERELWADAV